MNPRLAQLNQLLRIKHEAAKQAHLELVKIKEQFIQNKTRHEQLVIYRQDYLDQLEVLGSEGSSVGRLRNRIDFINHLDTALIQLNTHLGQIAKNRTKAQMNYNVAKASEEGIIKLIDRVKKAEELKLQRAEQKESDEYAQKQWYSKKMNDKSNTFGE